MEKEKVTVTIFTNAMKMVTVTFSVGVH